MSRTVNTRPPSFPQVELNTFLNGHGGETWQVICGDSEHWRAGFYSPAEGSYKEVKEFEKHDCPELFILLSGEITLALVENGKMKTVELEAGKPILVDAPHAGFCPKGPHSGVALVVERDSFDTEYRKLADW